MLGRAFQEDPLTVWLFPDAAARCRKLPRFFRSLLSAAFDVGEVHTTDEGVCAAVWNPPGTFPMGWRTDTRVGLVTARMVGPSIVRKARGLLYFAQHHPKEPHWYLQLLGTDPDHQGRGAASALLAPVLERCDGEGARIYLEASKEQNVPFYERHGFRVDHQIQVPDGPVMWAMWRDPGL